MIVVSIPTYRKVKVEHEESYTVFVIRVQTSERFFVIERRYSEFEELHKKLKKVISTPEFPPKKILKWSHKVLDQRREGLECYIQNLIVMDIWPKMFLQFLNIKENTISTVGNGSFDSLDQLDQGTTHQPVLAFEGDSFLQEQAKDGLPDIITYGALNGLYGSSDDIR